MGVQSIIASRLAPAYANQPAPSPRPSQQEQAAPPPVQPASGGTNPAAQRQQQSEQRPDVLEVSNKRSESALLQDASKTRAGTRLEIDDRTERVIAQILNKDREVIKQIPPEEKLDLIVRIRETQGLLFDELA